MRTTLHESPGFPAGGQVRPGRVLVVDDEPNIRSAFRLALESAGLTADEAADGDEALGRLARSAYDVVLLDLLMPGTDGMGVLRRLREAGAGVPVVVVTAHGSVPDAVAAMKLGAIDFLPKPVTPDALRGAVAEVIRRHQRESVEAGTDEQPSSKIGAPVPAEDPARAAIKRALNRREFGRASELLEQALDVNPDDPELLNLMGVLLESRGQDNTSYHCYKRALTVDPTYGPAIENMNRYCARHRLDADNPLVNPAARR